jgi:hypothetical protein
LVKWLGAGLLLVELTHAVTVITEELVGQLHTFTTRSVDVAPLPTMREFDFAAVS